MIVLLIGYVNIVFNIDKNASELLANEAFAS
jgi:hypothetical protein